MTVLRDALREHARRLAAAGVESADVDAELLARHVLGLGRVGLLLARDRELGEQDAARLLALVRRRETREPLQHILGEVEWGDLTLAVTPDALVPRPETEVLLHLALAALPRGAAPRVLDVGTGTGVLALGVKRARPDAVVYATDLSGSALALARRNAERLGLEVTFAAGDLGAGLSGPFDLIVSNPPYLPLADAAHASPEVRRDPTLALYAGEDGLSVARPLAALARTLLAPSGTLALELDPRNVRVLAGELTGWTVRTEPDLAGRERFLIARPD